MPTTSIKTQPSSPAQKRSKSAAPAPAPTINQQGQTLGRKGQQTRERLIDAVEQLLHTKPLRELRQAEICRLAKVSPPAFYVYFPDIEALVLEAIARNQIVPAELEQLLEEAWAPANTFEKARSFVLMYLEFWNRHYHLLKTRNLAADEGDARMIELRFSFQVPMLEKIAAKISAGQQTSGDRSLAPVAGAAIIMSSLERLAPTLRFGLGTEGMREDMTASDVIDAEAWVLTRMIGTDMPARAKK